MGGIGRGRVNSPRRRDVGFDAIARHYDQLMGFVNYDRWEATCSALADLLPQGFTHADFACGTGVLVNTLRKRGWRSVGFDLSRAMLHSGRKERGPLPLACADMRASPLHESVDLGTCLFDSLNFLLEPDYITQALAQMAAALKPGGILYVDVVTERMITEHFEGPEWTEKTGGITLRWRTRYDRHSRIAETTLRVNTGSGNTFRERVYPNAFLLEAIDKAGLVLLGCYDAHGWKAPAANTVRVDFVAVKPPAPKVIARYAAVEADIQSVIRGMPDVNG